MLNKGLKVVSWIFILFFFLIGFSLLATGEVLSAVFLLLFGLLLTPFLNNFIKRKFMKTFPLSIKILLGSLLLIGSGVFLSPSVEDIETPTEDVQVASGKDLDELENKKQVEEIIYYEVTSITDGDTIKVLIDNQTETIRLVNMNAPESVDPRKPVECMGKEASEQMKRLVEGKKVALEIDETQTDRDRFNRLLRFVFLEDGTDVGLEMIKLGFAQSTPYGNSPHKYLDLYEQAQQEAKAKELGLWNPLACLEPSPAPITNPTNVPDTPSPTKTPTTSNQSQETTLEQQPIVAPTTSQPIAGGVVKKSRSNICHAPGTQYYDQTTNFKAYNTIEECLASGGRLPKNQNQ